MEGEISRYRRFSLKGGQWMGQGRDRARRLASMDPKPQDGEVVEVLAAEDVLRALEVAYHPQNPTFAHPADAITKLFRLEGHEKLVLQQDRDRKRTVLPEASK